MTPHSLHFARILFIDTYLNTHCTQLQVKSTYLEIFGTTKTFENIDYSTINVLNFLLQHALKIQSAFKCLTRNCIRYYVKIVQ